MSAQRPRPTSASEPGDLGLDGLLAIFFFVVGLELKREFVAGDLRDTRAALPIAAAVGGDDRSRSDFRRDDGACGDGATRGGPFPPYRYRLRRRRAGGDLHAPSRGAAHFMLTLAVVDDLLAITVIAVFSTEHINITALVLAVIPLSAFAVCVQRRIRSWWLLIPLAALTWALVHESGVHATVAGVALGFTVPVLRSAAAGGPDAGPGLAEHFEHRIRPVSAGIAVPVFAFFAAGVTVGGYHGLTAALTDPIALGIVGRLVVEQGGWNIRHHPHPRSAPHGPPSTRRFAGSTSSAWHCWPASGSPSPC